VYDVQFVQLGGLVPESLAPGSHLRDGGLVYRTSGLADCVDDSEVRLEGVEGCYCVGVGPGHFGGVVVEEAAVEGCEEASGWEYAPC
jgi:hypothetical protein